MLPKEREKHLAECVWRLIKLQSTPGIEPRAPVLVDENSTPTPPPLLEGTLLVIFSWTCHEFEDLSCLLPFIWAKKDSRRGSKSFLPFAFHPTLQQRLFSKKCLSTIALVKQKKSSQQKDQWKNFERKALMKHWMKYLDKKYGNATTAFFLMGLLKSLKYQNDKSDVYE